jgi:Domain of unknown function (DUF4402)
MKFLRNIYDYYKRFLPALLSIVFICALCLDGFAQEPPPRPVVVTVTQNLGFGAFTQGGLGGTIVINTSSVRSATGDVILLNLGYTFSAASYKLVANAGTVISILNGSDVILPGSNGGSMTLHIGVSSPLSPFVINTVPPGFTMMNVGGTLTVGNPGSNPPGNYSGIFDITFIQE